MVNTKEGNSDDSSLQSYLFGLCDHLQCVLVILKLFNKFNSKTVRLYITS